MPTVHVSDVVYERLTAYRDAHEHTSYDSAVRELLPDGSEADR